MKSESIYFVCVAVFIGLILSILATGKNAPKPEMSTAAPKYEYQQAGLCKE